ncbi:protein ABHD13-like isoform X2 [Limulus polyphemus]|uniref:Protein ABHD13 n=1 Tax=Limulus polyphemus TaxID=6850 RepID=A0ABM1BLS8_LIMPO|nr:protein ABHD13-like isoform X2 [Limulus polyphemus]
MTSFSQMKNAFVRASLDNDGRTDAKFKATTTNSGTGSGTATYKITVNDNVKKLKTNPEQNPDFATITVVTKIVLFILKKCWIMCGASIMVIFVIYWYYGSFLALGLLFFALTGILYQVGDWLLYHPDQPPHSRLYVPAPAMFGLSGENIHISSGDGVKINLLLVKQDHSVFGQVPTILYLHGNAGNIGHRLANVRGLYHSCGCNVLLVEYRGYGHSDGTPSEEGLYYDSQAGLEFLLQYPGIDRSKIIVFGRSLGGAVAVDLASRPEYNKHIMALVLENTFTSIPDIGRVLFNWRIVKCIPTWFFKNQFQSKEKIKKVQLPTLFISGLADFLIPPHMVQELYKNSRSPVKRLATFESGTHNETWQCSGYYRTLNLFFDDVMVLRHQQGDSCHWPAQDVCVHVPAEVL